MEAELSLLMTYSVLQASSRAISLGTPNFMSQEERNYNALTGRDEKVGNWAGVTVDKKEHPIKVAALAYLMFNLYTPPCFAAIGAMNSEMKSAKWLWAGIGLQLGAGYSVAWLVYTVGTLITAPAALNVGAAVGGLAVMLVLIVICLYRAKKRGATCIGCSCAKKCGGCIGSRCGKKE